jgi:hypothetical protein
MLARVPYYKSILHVLSVLCRPECAPILAQPMPADVEGGTSVAAVAAQLSIPATQYIKVCIRGSTCGAQRLAQVFSD